MINIALNYWGLTLIGELLFSQQNHRWGGSRAQKCINCGMPLLLQLQTWPMMRRGGGFLTLPFINLSLASTVKVEVGDTQLPAS